MRRLFTFFLLKEEFQLHFAFVTLGPGHAGTLPRGPTVLTDAQDPGSGPEQPCPIFVEIGFRVHPRGPFKAEPGFG